MKNQVRSQLRIDTAKVFDQDGCQVFLELFGYFGGLQAMFIAFSAAAREGADLETALRVIARWFDKVVYPLMDAAAEFIDQPPGREPLPEKFNWLNSPKPPTEGFKDGSSDV
jgi:hypothetical protein